MATNNNRKKVHMGRYTGVSVITEPKKKQPNPSKKKDTSRIREEARKKQAVKRKQSIAERFSSPYQIINTNSPTYTSSVLNRTSRNKKINDAYNVVKHRKAEQSFKGFEETLIKHMGFNPLETFPIKKVFEQDFKELAEQEIIEKRERIANKGKTIEGAKAKSVQNALTNALEEAGFKNINQYIQRYDPNYQRYLEYSSKGILQAPRIIKDKYTGKYRFNVPTLAETSLQKNQYYTYPSTEFFNEDEVNYYKQMYGDVFVNEDSRFSRAPTELILPDVYDMTGGNEVFAFTEERINQIKDFITTNNSLMDWYLKDVLIGTGIRNKLGINDFKYVGLLPPEAFEEVAALGRFLFQNDTYGKNSSSTYNSQAKYFAYNSLDDILDTGDLRLFASIFSISLETAESAAYAQDLFQQALHGREVGYDKVAKERTDRQNARFGKEVTMSAEETRRIYDMLPASQQEKIGPKTWIGRQQQYTFRIPGQAHGDSVWEVAGDPRQYYLSDYENKYEVNSLRDLIYNIGRGDYLPKKLGGEGNKSLWDDVRKYYHRYIEAPIKAGDFGALGLNMLGNMAETIDLVSSPVKSVLLPFKDFVQANDVQYGVPLEERKQMSFGDLGNRISTNLKQHYSNNKNIDFTEGSFAENLTFEILSDPLTYASLGLTGILKAGTKDSIKSILKQSVEEISDASTKTLVKSIDNVFMDKVSIGAWESFIKGDIKEFGAQVEYILKNTFSKNKVLSENTIKDVSKHIANSSTDIFANALTSANKVSKQYIASNVLKGMYEVNKIVNKVDTAVIKASLTPVIYPGGWAIKNLLGRKSKYSVVTAIEAWQANRMTKYSRTDGEMNILDIQNNMAKFREDYTVNAMTNKYQTGMFSAPDPVLESVRRASENDYKKILEFINEHSGNPDDLAEGIDILLKGQLQNPDITLDNLIKLFESTNRSVNGLFDKELSKYIEIAKKRDEVIQTAKKTKYIKNLESSKQAIANAMNELDGLIKSINMDETLFKVLQGDSAKLKKAIRSGSKKNIDLVYKEISEELAEYGIKLPEASIKDIDLFLDTQLATISEALSNTPKYKVTEALERIMFNEDIDFEESIDLIKSELSLEAQKYFENSPFMQEMNNTIKNLPLDLNKQIIPLFQRELSEYIVKIEESVEKFINKYLDSTIHNTPTYKLPEIENTFTDTFKVLEDMNSRIKAIEDTLGKPASKLKPKPMLVGIMQDLGKEIGENSLHINYERVTKLFDSEFAIPLKDPSVGEEIFKKAYDPKTYKQDIKILKDVVKFLTGNDSTKSINELGLVYKDEELLKSLNHFLELDPLEDFTEWSHSFYSIERGLRDIKTAIKETENVVGKEVSLLSKEMLQDIDTALSKVYPNKMDAAIMSMSEGSRYVKIATERLTSSAMLSYHKVIEDILDEHGSVLGRIVNGFSKDGTPILNETDEVGKLFTTYATEIRARVAEITAYRNFIADLDSLPISQEIKISLLQSLQNFYKTEPSRWLIENSGKENVLIKLLKSIDVNLDASYGAKRNSLDVFRQRMLDETDEFSKLFTEEEKIYFANKAHDALRDARFNAKILKYSDPDLYNDIIIGKDNWLTFDLETTGLKQKDQLLEIGWFNIKTGEEGHLIRKVTEEQMDSLLKEMDIDAKITLARIGDAPEKELDAVLKERHVAKNESELMSEEKMLRDFDLAVPNKPELVAHNGDNFDFDFLFNRMRANEYHSINLTKAKHHDTLYNLRKDQKLVLTYDEKTAISNAMRRFAKNLMDVGASNTAYFKIDDIIDNLKGMARSTADEELVNILFTAAEDLTDTLKSISTWNSLMSEYAIMDITKAEFNDFWKPYIKKYLNLNDETINYLIAKKGSLERQAWDELLQRKLVSEVLGIAPEDLPARINSIQALTTNNLIPPVVFKDILNGKVFSKYFSIGSKELPPQIIQEAVDFGKIIEHKVGTMYTNTAIQNNELKIRLALIKLLESDLIPSDSIFKSLNTDQGVYTNYMMLSTLSEKFIARNLDSTLGVSIDSIKGTLQDLKINEDVIDIIVDETGNIRKSFDSTFKETEESLAEDAISYLNDPLLLSSAIDAFKRQEASLQDLSRALDEGHGFNSRAIAINSAQKDIVEIHNEISELSREELKHMQAEQFKAKKIIVENITKDRIMHYIKDPSRLLHELCWDIPIRVFDLTELSDFDDVIRTFRSMVNRFKELHINMYEQDGLLFVNLTEKSKWRRVELTDMNGNKSIGFEVYYRKFEEPPKYNTLETPRTFSKKFEWFPEKVDKAFKTIVRLSGGRGAGATGGILTESTLSSFVKNLPKTVRDSMGDIVDRIEDGITGSTFDRIAPNAYAFKHRIKDMYNADISTGLINTTRQLTATTESLLLYADLFFNKESAITISGMRKFGYSYEDILRIIQEADGDYKLAALVPDKGPIGFRMRLYTPTTVNQLKKIEHLEPVLLPNQVFSKAFEVINPTTFNNKYLKAIQGMMHMYKVGFLVDVGVFFRNFVDSSLKTMIDTGTFTSTIAAEMQAFILLKNFNDVIKEIGQANSNRLITKDMVNEYFSRLKESPTGAKMSKQEFDLVHGFINNGPSAGETSALRKMYKMDNVSDDKIFNVWGTYVNTANKLMGPNSWAEQVARLGEFIILEERGLTKTQIFNQISKTHFDYALKNKFTLAMELIIPFYNFTKLNLEYWCRVVSEQPWAAHLLMKRKKTGYLLSGMDQEDVQKNRSLSSMIMNGNLLVNDDGTTLKVNPSYMDAFQLFTDPVSTGAGRLAAPLQVILGTFAQGQIGVDNDNNIFGAMAYSLLNDSKPSALSIQNNFMDQLIANMSIKDTPILGTFINRYMNMGLEYAERSGHEWQKATPGLFGAIKPGYKSIAYPKKDNQVWGPRGEFYEKSFGKRLFEYMRDNVWDFSKSGWKNYNKGSGWKNYNKGSGWKNYAFYPSSYGNQYVNTYGSYRKHMKTLSNFYSKYYTKTGKSKLALRSIPTSPSNIRQKLRDYYHYWDIYH